MNQQAAVGTTMALLERGSRVMSAIHKRIYGALKNEFELLANVFSTYTHLICCGQRQIKLQTLMRRLISYLWLIPNNFSQSQRISLAQTQYKLAQSNPRS